MKKLSTDRLIGLLLLSGYTRSQVFSALRELRYISGSELEYKLDRQYDFLRDYEEFSTEGEREGVARKQSSGQASRSSYPGDRDNSNVEHELYSRIHEMLGVRLGLSTSEIAHLISDQLSLKYNNAVPPLSKKSLGNWLSRLLLNYSPSEILHVVATISNKFGSSTKIDWPVREDKSD